MAEAQSRVVDYLDDQIQTAADLDGIDALIARVDEQQTILQKQLEEAQNARLEAEKKAQSQAITLQQQALDFQRKQRSIDEQLKAITTTDTDEDAVKSFEARMTKVRRLEIATGYLEVVQEVDTLTRESRHALSTDPRSSLRTYTKLRSLSNALKQAQPDAEGAAPHLVDRVETQANAVEEELRSGFEKDFKSTLEKMKWPKREMNLLGDIMPSWTEQTELLLQLQEPDLLSKTAHLAEDSNTNPPVLLPLEVMVQPLAQRFRYHFYGDRPTNRLDKPQYFLSHILELLDTHSTFIMEALQPVLDQRIHALEELENVYTDAASSFITALLPLVMTKSLSVLPQLSPHPQLISHFVHELMSFDTTLRESWGYNPSPVVLSDWKGIAWSILITHNYFNTWISVEKDFALTRYKTIRDASESTEIDYDGVLPSQTKPTKGAIRVNDLLETVTDRYRSLSSFSQKMRFLIDVQLSIFDDYHNYLHAALQSYLANSHTAGRLLQGQSKLEALGQRGLASLCKIYGSAEFLERKMSDWGDDVFFIELWEELQDRARSKSSGRNGSLGRDLLVEDVAAKTSSAIKQNGAGSNLGTEGGGLFDETALAYRRLKEQSEVEILRLVEVNVHDAVVPLAQLESWTSLSTPISNPADLGPSAALDSSLQTISTLLGFLAKAFAPAPLRKVVKHFCSTLQSDIYEQVVLKHSFSTAGVAQLKRDISAIEHAIETTTHSRGIAATGLKKLNQALTLLGLPVKPSSKRHLTASISADDTEGAEDDWGFGDDADGDAQTQVTIIRTDDQDPSLNVITKTATEEYDSPWSLWAAERQIFESNEAARRALAEMELDLLSEAEARNVLKRRVEVGS